VAHLFKTCIITGIKISSNAADILPATLHKPYITKKMKKTEFSYVLITGYHECEKQKSSIKSRCKNLTADTKNTKTIKPLKATE